jgi:hypothetical protein
LLSSLMFFATAAKNLASSSGSWSKTDGPTVSKQMATVRTTEATTVQML